MCVHSLYETFLMGFAILVIVIIFGAALFALIGPEIDLTKDAKKGGQK
jgi:uncharacterized membrane protein